MLYQSVIILLPNSLHRQCDKIWLYQNQARLQIDGFKGAEVCAALFGCYRGYWPWGYRMLFVIPNFSLKVITVTQISLYDKFLVCEKRLILEVLVNSICWHLLCIWIDSEESLEEKMFLLPRRIQVKSWNPKISNIYVPLCPSSSIMRVSLTNGQCHRNISMATWQWCQPGTMQLSRENLGKVCLVGKDDNSVIIGRSSTREG